MILKNDRDWLFYIVPHTAPVRAQSIYHGLFFVHSTMGDKEIGHSSLL